MTLADWLIMARPVVFVLLMTLFMLGLLAYEWQRKQVTVAQRSWFPEREPAVLPPNALAAPNADPNSPDHTYHMGLAFMAHGHWHQAESCYRLTLEIDPQHRDAAFNLAHLTAATGRLPEAIAAYRALLAFEPEDASALYNLGHLYFQLRIYPQAHQAWKAAMLIEPQAEDVRANLRFLRQLRKGQSALARPA